MRAKKKTENDERSAKDSPKISVENEQTTSEEQKRKASPTASNQAAKVNKETEILNNK